MNLKKVFKSPYWIFILAFLLRFLWLTKIPYRVDGDSSRFALDGINAWQDHWPLFSTGWYGHTNVLFYAIGLLLKLIKYDLLGIRSFSALGGTLSVITTYFMTKTLTNKKIAFWSSLFLATCPFHLVFSRTGTEAVWATFFVPLVIYLYLQKKPWLQFLAGVFCGLSQYVYPGLRLLPILIFILTVLLIQNCRTFKKTISLLIVFSLGLIISYGPMVFYYLQHPHTYNARIQIVGIVQSGWLKSEAEKIGLFKVVVNQLTNSYLAFHWPVKNNFVAWYYRTPFLDLLPSLFFIIGLIYGLIKLKNMSWRFIYTYLLVGIFLAGVLTLGSPSPSRYVILFPTVSIFISAGIVTLLQFVRKRSNKKVYSISQLLLMLFIIITSLISYYRHETVDTWKYDTNTQIATYAGRYLASLPNQDYYVYFLGSKNMNFNAIPTLHFLAQKWGNDIFEPLSIDMLSISTKKAYFIFLPHRKNEISILKDTFPEATQKDFYNPLGELLFYLVEV